MRKYQFNHFWFINFWISFNYTFSILNRYSYKYNKDEKIKLQFDFREKNDISKYKELRFLLSLTLVFNETIDNEDITAYYYNIEKNEEHISNGFGNNL